MKIWFTACLLAGVVAGAVAPALSQYDTPAPASTSAGSAAPAPSASPAAAVHTKDFAYDPKIVKVKTGDSVEFINDDEIAHTITATDHAFDSGNLDQHQNWTYVFAKAGTYTYYCMYHPFMKAKIVVSSP